VQRGGCGMLCPAAPCSALRAVLCCALLCFADWCAAFSPFPPYLTHHGSLCPLYPPGKLPPTPQLLTAWRETLGQCMGFPTSGPAPLYPLKLMFVDR